MSSFPDVPIQKNHKPVRKIKKIVRLHNSISYNEGRTEAEGV
jgi:hypothetical protein